MTAGTLERMCTRALSSSSHSPGVRCRTLQFG